MRVAYVILSWASLAGLAALLLWLAVLHPVKGDYSTAPAYLVALLAAAILLVASVAAGGRASQLVMFNFPKAREMGRRCPQRLLMNRRVFEGWLSTLPK